MPKKNSRITHRAKQRQKLSQRTIILIAASGLACMTVALLIFFQGSNVESSMAASQVYTVVEDAPTVEVTLDAPVIKSMPAIGPNTVLVRPLKAEYNHSNQQPQ